MRMDKEKGPACVLEWSIERNGYETQQSSLLYVFVRFFGLDRAQNTTAVYY